MELHHTTVSSEYAHTLHAASIRSLTLLTAGHGWYMKIEIDILAKLFKLTLFSYTCSLAHVQSFLSLTSRWPCLPSFLINSLDPAPSAKGRPRPPWPFILCAPSRAWRVRARYHASYSERDDRYPLFFYFGENQKWSPLMLTSRTFKEAP